jgi:quinolinate synthase
MLSIKLKREGVKNVIVNDIEYFDVQDIKENHPELKVDTSKIVYLNGTALIKADYVYTISEFDKTIKQIFPKKD